LFCLVDVKLSWVDKNTLFSERSIGDFVLCVKGKVEALCGSPSYYLEIRLMRGGHSEVGKAEKSGEMALRVYHRILGVYHAEVVTFGSIGVKPRFVTNSINIPS